MTIDILLATYNGEKYLPEQLDSILQQTNHDWRIVARDDGSTDRTRSILYDYAEKVNAKYGKGKFVIVLNDDASRPDMPGIKHALHNFGTLMEWSKEDGKADYAMFSDQDDVWHKDKIEKTLKAMHALETTSEKGTPLLVHTDATVVSADGTPQRDASYMNARHLDPRRETFRNNLVECPYQGCTMMMNKPLLELATPAPDVAHSHDMWVGLVAAAAGKHAYLDEPTLDYRQHGGNVYGARSKLKDQVRRAFQVLQSFTRQAEALHERCYEKMPPETRHDLDRYLEISKEDQPMRGFHLAREGYRRNASLKHNITLFGDADGQGSSHSSGALR